MIEAKLVHSEYGSFYDVVQAVHLLNEGMKYKVKNISAGRDHTDIELEGFDKPFNSVQFEFYEDGKPLDIYNDERFQSYLMEVYERVDGNG